MQGCHVVCAFNNDNVSVGNVDLLTPGSPACSCDGVGPLSVVGIGVRGKTGVGHGDA